MTPRPLRALFMLVTVICSLHMARAERYVMHLQERGTQFDEEVEVDEKNEVEVFKVPPHNNINGAVVMNDFKLGLTATRIPVQKACYISDIIPDAPKPAKLKEDLERASHSKTLPKKTIQYRWLNEGYIKRRNLPQSLRDFCGSLPTYKASLLTGNSTRFQSIRHKRQTIITKKTLRFCDESNKLRFIQNCIDVPVWDLDCDFKNATCFYLVRCEHKGYPRRDWVCSETHTYNIQTMCCNYGCPAMTTGRK